VDEIAYGSDAARPRWRTARVVLVAVVAAAVGAGVAHDRQRSGQPAQLAASASATAPAPRASEAEALSLTAGASPSATAAESSTLRRPARGTALTGRRLARGDPGTLLLTTDDGPVLYDTATGRLTDLVDTPGRPDLGPPLSWSFVRSGSVIFARASQPAESGFQARGFIYLLRGRRLTRLLGGTDVVSAATPGHVLVVTHRETGPTNVIELDSAGEQVGLGHEIPRETTVVRGLSGGLLLLHPWTEEYHVSVWDLDARRVRTRLPGGGSTQATSKVVAGLTCRDFSVGCTVTVVSLGGPPRREWRLPPGAIAYQQRISADGKRLALRVTDIDNGGRPIEHRVVVMDLQSGELSDVPGTRLAEDVRVAFEWGPDSHGLALATSGLGPIAVWRLGGDHLDLLPEVDRYVDDVLCVEGC
jgi:hypothetical protein